jgi:putative ABC transport system permease protein
VPAYVLRRRVAAFVVSPAAVSGVGLTTAPYALLASPRAGADPPDAAAQQRLDAALWDIAPGFDCAVERGPPTTPDPVLLLVAIAAGVITLGAAGAATGLAAVDGRNDLAILDAIGAGPRMRRLLSLCQAGLISGVGTMLGMGAGFGAAFAVLAATNDGLSELDRWPHQLLYTPTVPWAELALLPVVPLIAMLGAGLLTRSSMPIERRPG